MQVKAKRYPPINNCPIFTGEFCITIQITDLGKHLRE